MASDSYQSAAIPVKPDASQPPLVAVIGPTGSGKSALALEIAIGFDGEVVNCDSLQVYRYFDVGTAKLRPGERRGIPHHLLDIVNPDEVFTAGEYARLGRLAIADITARGHLPVIAGGTGFYLRALLDGLFEGPSRDQTLRDRLAAREARRPGSLHRLLRRLDGEDEAVGDRTVRVLHADCSRAGSGDVGSGDGGVGFGCVGGGLLVKGDGQQKE